MGTQGMRRLPAAAAALMGIALSGTTVNAGEVLDRVVAVVGNNAVTSSEVELQLRLEAFLNRRPLDASEAARRQVIERLIEVNMIAEEMRVTNLPPAKDEEVAEELRAVREQDFTDELEFLEALEAHSLDEDELRGFLRRQMNVLRFIDFRFRTGLDVSVEAVGTYYRDVYTPRVRQLEGREPEPQAEVRGRLREVVLQQRVDELLDDWLKLARAATRIEYVTAPPTAGRAVAPD